MKQISNKEHKKILIEILDYIHNTCVKNDIKYTLVYGSLIGAIRDKGIIPWDDDVDVAFDIENYNKFIKIINKNKDSRYQLINNKINSSYYLPFDKVIDKKTMVLEKGRRKIEDYGVFVDVFVFHNMPNNSLVGNIHYKRIVFWENMIFGYSNTDLGSKHIFLKKARRYVSEKIGIDKILKKYNKELTRYDKKNTKYVITSWPDFGYKREKLEKEWLNKYHIIDFENIKSMVFVDFDNILKRLYGDYMTPPSIENRISQHHLEMYWRD